eukprot:CFRG4510T1
MLDIFAACTVGTSFYAVRLAIPMALVTGVFSSYGLTYSSLEYEKILDTPALSLAREYENVDIDRFSMQDGQIYNGINLMRNDGVRVYYSGRYIFLMGPDGGRQFFSA